jgi:hypothetical protein
MKPRCLPLFAGLLLLAGCLGKETTPLVPESPFGKAPPPPQPQRAAYGPASVETAKRVNQVGQRIVAANPQIGIRPLFVTVGAPQVEMFHRGTNELTVTEGLVHQCATDAHLAAVLSLELGKMVAEREALAAPQSRHTGQRPPADLRLGSNNGPIGTSDFTSQAELARYDPPRPRHVPAASLPDPRELARVYLANAGFAAADLDRAAPIVDAARASSSLEKQLTHPGPARPWTP